MAAKNKLGFQDVAKAAGVSLATVSRVVNGTARVHPEIQKKVRSAAASLGIDLAQRSKTRALAFLLSNRAMLHSFHSRVLVGAEACCSARGWDMVFLSFNYAHRAPWNEIHLPSVVQRRDVVRGVILAGTNSPNLLELLVRKGIAFAVLGNNVMGEAPEVKYDAVFSDDVQGGKDMTRHMIRLGHRKICFIGNTRLPWFARCYSGYRSVMEEAGLEPIESNIDSENEAEIGYLGTKSLLARGTPVTAIFAGNDPTAQGVYKALRDSRLQVPDDISVGGCDDTLGSLMHPALTTIREFPEQLGRHMVEMLLHRLDNPGDAPQQATIPTEFVSRDSCRPGPAAAEHDEVLQEVAG